MDDTWNPKLFVFENDGYFDIANRNKNDAGFLSEQLEELDLDLIKEERARQKELAAQEAELENFASGTGGGFGGDSGGGGRGQPKDKYTNYGTIDSADNFKLNTDLGNDLKGMASKDKGFSLGEGLENFKESLEFMDRLDSRTNTNNIETAISNEQSNQINDNFTTRFVEQTREVKPVVQNEPPKAENLSVDDLDDMFGRNVKPIARQNNFGD